METKRTQVNRQLLRAREAIKRASIIVIALAIIYTIIALISDSVGLLAKAIDSITDLVTIGTVFLGLWLAQRPPSEQYPYGYFKAETLAALIVAVFISITGIIVLWEAVQRILLPTVILNLNLALIVSLLLIPVIFTLSWYLKRVGKETGSEAVYNTGQELRMDILASFAVFIGLTFSWFGFPWIEPIAGFLIGIFIIKNSLELTYDSVLTLMDAVRDQDQIKAIEELVKPIQGVKGIHDTKMRWAGPICFGEMHLEVAGDLTVLQSHRLAEEISHRVKEAFPNVMSFFIHVEPATPEFFRIAFPVYGADATPASNPSHHFGTVPYFLVMDIEHRQIINWEILSNPAAKEEKQRGRNTAHLLIEANVDFVLAEEMGETPLSILRNNLISVYRQNSESNCIENMIALFKGDLPPLTPKLHPPHHHSS